MEIWIALAIAAVAAWMLVKAGDAYLKTQNHKRALDWERHEFEQEQEQLREDHKRALDQDRNEFEQEQEQLREDHKRALDRDRNEFEQEQGRFETYKEQEAATARRRKAEIEQLAREKSIGFPLLAKAYAEYFEFEHGEVARALEQKRNPAPKAAETVRDVGRNFRQVEHERRVLKYVVEYYESLFPWLEELRDPNIDDALIAVGDEAATTDRRDPVRNWLTEGEYNRLSVAEKSDLALQRYMRRHKANWEIGKDYERYIGYQMEQSGYEVSYQGIIEGLSDLGRDLVCSKDGGAEIIQCKMWSKQKEIHEKHVFQLFGTLTAYKIDNPGIRATGTLTTSTKLSGRAQQFARELGIAVQQEVPLGKYPMVKCNVSRQNGDMIYHLPFDQMYDRTAIEPKRGERYAWSAQEAESMGYRRAFKWRGAE